MYTPCTPHVHPMYTPCTPYVHPMYTPCTPYVHPMYTLCTSSMQHMSFRVNDNTWPAQCMKKIQGNLDRTMDSQAVQSAPPSVMHAATVSGPIILT